MVSYSAHEYIDMIIAYGACEGNCHAACRLYAERFPGRKRHPSNRVIQSCIQRLRETGSVFVNRKLLSLGVQMMSVCTEEKILQEYEDTGKSVRHIARSFGVSRNSVYRILDRNGVRLGGLQRLQQLARDEKQDDTSEDASNVSAIEKSTDKENNITIANDKSHLSKKDIERTVNEGEKYQSEDE